MLLNLDILQEIINYLDYEEDEGTLRSLAITCRRLSDLALGVIWRKRKAHQNIVSVANSFAPSPKEPFLRYTVAPVNKNGRHVAIGSWVLTKSLPPVARKRTLEYLARIRHLVVLRDGSRDMSIWPVLYTCLDSHGPLLPNLKSLEVLFNNTYDQIEYIIPLLSPSIKVLVISCGPPPKDNAILTILNIVKARGCDLEDFTYSGRPIHSIPEVITSFKNLQQVSLPLDCTPQPKAPVTIVQFLTALPSLRSFTCYIGAFLPSTDKVRLCHAGLHRIKIISTPVMLRQLFCVCVFPSVTNVKILSNEILSMDGIESSLPNTRNLGYSQNYPRSTIMGQPLEFRHLASLLSLPIQSFKLRVQQHTLTPSDLSSLAESWPDICVLKIVSRTKFDPLPSLAVFANHQRLDRLKLQLPLHCLLDNISKVQDLIEADVVTEGRVRPPLRALSWYCGDSVLVKTLVSVTDKRVLVEYLLRLFPSLQELQFEAIHPFTAFDPSDLQTMLVEMRTQKWEGVVNSA